jgi:hypothetical protein
VAAIDAGSLDAVVQALDGLDVFLCGTPFAYIGGDRAALRAGVGMVDYGGHTPTVLKQDRTQHWGERSGSPSCRTADGAGNE